MGEAEMRRLGLVTWAVLTLAGCGTSVTPAASGPANNSGGVGYTFGQDGAAQDSGGPADGGSSGLDGAAASDAAPSDAASTDAAATDAAGADATLDAQAPDTAQDGGAGTAVCGDGQCTALLEGCASCPQDCGKCQAVCGDGKCEQSEESCTTCAQDCGKCPASCGNGKCEAPEETCSGCEVDCGKCPASCGNGKCETPQESCTSCEVDCGKCPVGCGNGKCDVATENCQSCEVDCGKCPAFCGDGKCDAGTEDCKSCLKDCGACPAVCGDGKCEAPETSLTCAKDCPAGTCDPLTSSGCKVGEQCYHGGGKPVCALPGNTPKGGACSNDTQCAKGHMCISSKCGLICDSSGKNAAVGCPTNALCDKLIYSDGKEVGYNLGVCAEADNCNLTTDVGCPSDQACYFLADKKLTICAPFGKVGVGGSCPNGSDCVKGTLCLKTKAGQPGTCMAKCDSTGKAPTCSKGACAGISYTLAENPGVPIVPPNNLGVCQ